MPPSQKKRRTTPADKGKWVDWRKCPGREVLLDDLKRGALPLTEEELSTEHAWSFYREMTEFDKIVFSQFKERLKAHRKQAVKLFSIVAADEAAFQKDLQMGFRNTRKHNKRGELVFDLSPAKQLLRDDVKDKKHEGLTPSEFRRTRPEYMKFRVEIFKGRIYQEVKRQKFIFHCELKRKLKGRAKPGFYSNVQQHG